MIAPSMNGYQRIAAVINGRWPDTTPVMPHNFVTAARKAGVSMRVSRRDPRLIAKSFVQAVEPYEYDGIKIEVDAATRAGAAGVRVDFPEDEPARVIEGKMDSLAEVPDFQPVDILSCGGVLAPGTPELVRRQRGELPTMFPDTPRFILNSGRATPPTTPPENRFSLIQTARDFRR